MWIKCKCGIKIFDISDRSRDKARLYPEEDWFNISERNDSNFIERGDLIHYRTVLQCSECFRIYIEDMNGKFISFKAEDEISTGFLGERN